MYKYMFLLWTNYSSFLTANLFNKYLTKHISRYTHNFTRSDNIVYQFRTKFIKRQAGLTGFVVISLSKDALCVKTNTHMQ
jgi:hypothetical protein